MIYVNGKWLLTSFLVVFIGVLYPGGTGIWKYCFFFWREENPLPEDKSSEKGENQQQAQPGKGNKEFRRSCKEKKLRNCFRGESIQFQHLFHKLSRECAVGNPSAIEGQTANMYSRTGL